MPIVQLHFVALELSSPVIVSMRSVLFASAVLLSSLLAAACNLPAARGPAGAGGGGGQGGSGGSGGAPVGADACYVFTTIGDSNIRGRGDAATSRAANPLPAGRAFEFTGRSVLVPLRDPVGQANSGSAWPAFARTALDGGMPCVVIVPAAIPGSSFISTGNTWGPPDSEPTARAIERTQQAMQAVEADGSRAIFGGWLVGVGGGDAKEYAPISTVRASFRGFIERYAARYAGVPMLYIPPGYAVRRGQRLEPASLIELRQALADECTEQAACIVASTAFQDAAVRDFIDALHFGQGPLQRLGEDFGRAALQVHGFSGG